MKKLKNERGITLIALIVTIIVLLILAGIGISLIMNDGIIFKASETSVKHTVAEIDEALRLKLAEEKISGVLGEGNSLGDSVNVIDIGVTDQTIYTYLVKVWLKEYGNYIETINKGNIYDKETGKLLIESAYWIPTDFIYPYELPAGVEDPDYDPETWLVESVGVMPLGINTKLGEDGSLKKMELDQKQSGNPGELPVIPDKNIFIIDANNNVYYIDKEGNIIGPKVEYKADKINISNSSFNYNLLTEKEKAVYDGIYEGALAFTKDEEYAKKLAEADLDNSCDFKPFIMGGYAIYTIVDSEGKVIVNREGKELNSLAPILITPTGEDVAGYLLDDEYNMYLYNSNTKTLEDKDGTIAENIDISTVSGDGLREVEYNGYKYSERFDGRDVIITAVPDKEVLNMKEDLKDLNVYSINNEIFKDKKTKRVIFPETMKTLTAFNIQRTMEEGGSGTIQISGVLEDSVNLEYVELPNSIEKIYARTFKGCSNLKEVILPDNLKQIGQNAFKGCSHITLKTKNVVISGFSWGAEYMRLTHK